MYDADSLRVENYAELLGSLAYFTAEGRFEEADRAVSRCPKDFNVEVEQGGIVIRGKCFLSSAITGSGFLRVRYVDGDIRILESARDSPGRWEAAGLQVVQVRDALFGQK